MLLFKTMRKYILCVYFIFFFVFSFSVMADENTLKPLQKTSLQEVEKIQWHPVQVYGATYQEIYQALNNVMIDYFFRLIDAKDGGAWQQQQKKGDFVIEWIQLEPNTLMLIAKITKDPAHLFLAMQTQTYKNNKWVPVLLNIRDKNLFYDIIEQIQFAIRKQ